MARNNLAAALFSSEQYADAAAEFREALKLDPSYENARYNLARTLAAQGDKSAALAELERHLSANPGDAEAHELFGRLSGSVPHFRRAAELEPDNPAFLINLGAALAISGDTASAIAPFEKALQLDPTNTAAKENLDRARRALEKR